MHFQNSFKMYKKVDENKEIEAREDNVEYQGTVPNCSPKTPNTIHRFAFKPNSGN